MSSIIIIHYPKTTTTMKHLSLMLVIASVLLVAILIVLNLPGYALTVFVTLVAMALNIWVEEGNANRRKVNRYKSMEAYNRINNPKAVNRYKRVQ